MDGLPSHLFFRISFAAFLIGFVTMFVSQAVGPVLVVGLIITFGNICYSYGILRKQSDSQNPRTDKMHSKKTDSLSGQFMTVSDSESSILFRVEYIPIDATGPENSDMDEIFNLISELDDPDNRRLVVTHFRSGTKLVDTLTDVLNEGRPISQAILKGVARNTDLMAYGRLSTSRYRGQLVEFIGKYYSEVILCAPTIERTEWLDQYSRSVDLNSNSKEISA